MSNYTKWTKHPVTGTWHKAEWLDDFFGPHRYGVLFRTGDENAGVFPKDGYDWETSEINPDRKRYSIEELREELGDYSRGDAAGELTEEYSGGTARQFLDWLEVGE